ncbi:MAG: isoprenylcysteine carboxylmethyltransferase family protein [Pseudomonadota bacterium]
MQFTDPRLRRIQTLVSKASRPPAGIKRILLAVTFGILCHTVFAAGVLAMIAAMFFGMSESFGTVPWPWAAVTNAMLVLQFPVAHSWLLTKDGGKLLSRIIPGQYGATLSTTTYAIIASMQLLILFVFWTPTGIVWWRAEGVLFWIICSLYCGSWLLLAKASFDAGAEVQSGALGWMSMLANIKPVFPDMPNIGLFRHIRHPIYAAFTLTLWTVPVWTPDQLALALSLSLYCLLAPVLKERRFSHRYREKFHDYRSNVPYFLPRITLQKRKRRNATSDSSKAIKESQNA